MFVADTTRKPRPGEEHGKGKQHTLTIHGHCRLVVPFIFIKLYFLYFIIIIPLSAV